MSTYPPIPPGSRTTSALLTSSLTVLAYKAVSQTVTNSTTFQDDVDLSLPLAAGGIYRARFVIFALSGSATPDIKTAWAVPGDATGLKMVQGPTDTATAFVSRSNTAARTSGHGFTTSIVYQVDTLAVGIEEEAIIVMGPTAGAVTLQWAQNTASTTGTTVQAGSYLTVERLG